MISTVFGVLLVSGWLVAVVFIICWVCVADERDNLKVEAARMTKEAKRAYDKYDELCKQHEAVLKDQTDLGRFLGLAGEIKTRKQRGKECF